LPAARHWLCLLLLLQLRLLLLLLNHGNHAWLLLLLALLLWHHSCLLLLGRHHLLLPLLQHLSPHLSLPLLLEFLNEQRALRGIHALQHLALLFRQLDGVALQLDILSPLLLALVGQKQAALGQILLLLPRIHSAELLALLKTELLDVLLDDLLLALHVRGHGPWLGAGGRQNTGLLHYPTHHLLLRRAPAPLLLLQGRPSELTALLLLLPGRCRLRTALLLQPQLLLVRLQDVRPHPLLLLWILPVPHGGWHSWSHRGGLLLYSYVHLLALLAHGLVLRHGHGGTVAHGLHRNHLWQWNLLATNHGLNMSQVLSTPLLSRSHQLLLLSL
jgi:hypothetical protein